MRARGLAFLSLAVVVLLGIGVYLISLPVTPAIHPGSAVDHEREAKACVSHNQSALDRCKTHECVVSPRPNCLALCEAGFRREMGFCDAMRNR